MRHVFLAALVLVACEDPPVTRHDAGRLPPASLGGLACASGSRCAVGAPHIEGTCCALGDNLVALPRGSGSEVVDLETDGDVVITCGGFGAQFDDVTNPDDPRRMGYAGSRCQHASFGPDVEGGRLAFLSHHGDSWVREPTIYTVLIGDDGSVTERVRSSDPSLLFEGLRYHDGYLYVAAHETGLLVYRVNGTASLTLVTTVGGLGNAWKVEIDERALVALVVDANAGLIGLSIEDPTAPRELWRLSTSAAPRDLAIDGDRLYVALGGSGVDVLDAPSPASSAPTIADHVDTLGSAQSVDAENGVLAVAAWSHAALYDAETLDLIATEKTRLRTSFEQDLAIAMVDDIVYVGEWEGLHVLRYREGYVAPNLFIEEALFAFDSSAVDAHAVITHNLGPLPLVIDSLSTTASDRYRFDVTHLVVPPFDAGVFEIVFTPPSGRDRDTLTLTTNDPDEESAPIYLVTTDTDRLSVGDRINDRFAFLDPSGGRRLEGLEGNIVVLAYFALF